MIGSKRKSDFADPSRPAGFPALFPRQPHSSQSSDESPSPHNSYEGRLPKLAEQPLLPSMQTPASFEGVLSHISDPLPTPLAGNTFPFPSPETSAVYTLPPLSLSTQKTTAFISHAKNPSHESWAEDPMLQNLQREKADLVSAYSQARNRMADLDKIVQTSSLEIGRLFKEGQGLKAKIDVLEAEVDELQTSIEVNQQQTVAKDAQYSQILELSTRLQSQAGFDGQQRKVDKEQWELEKHDMLQTITALRSEIRTLCNSSREASTPKRTLSGVGTAASTSPMDLETEVAILRHANSTLEDTLTKVRQEHAQLYEHVERLGGLSRNIQRHLQAASTGESISGTPDEERREIWQGRVTDDH